MTGWTMVTNAGATELMERPSPDAAVFDASFCEAVSAIDAGEIRAGVDVNAPSRDLYAHGTPLHHAVCSGCLDAVHVLAEAGADLNIRDTAWGGTPLGWAEHYIGECKADASKQYVQIAEYLRACHESRRG